MKCFQMKLTPPPNYLNIAYCIPVKKKLGAHIKLYFHLLIFRDVKSINRSVIFCALAESFSDLFLINTYLPDLPIKQKY